MIRLLRHLLLCVCIGALLAACSKVAYCPIQPQLSTICIVDQDGLSETISTKDRLEKFEKVNFLASQPYQKVIRVYGRDQTGDIQAYITSYHPNGCVKQYLEVVNNRACGQYQEWHENGKMKLDARVIGGVADLGTSAENSWLFDGVSCAWDAEGNMLAEIPYCKGVIEGECIHYHLNGNVWKQIHYTGGNVHGINKTYLENGRLFLVNEYDSGVRHGPLKRYWENGNLAAEETYAKGRLEEGRYKDINGNIVATVDDGDGTRAIFGKQHVHELQEYREGIQDGQVRTFNEDGSLFSTHSVKNDLKHGEEIEYYLSKKNQSKPVPKVSINWAEGKIQGMVKTWYPSGVQESQRELSENKKNGLLTAWYMDGSLMMIEEYDHDKLQKGKYFKKGDKLPIGQIRDGNGVAFFYDAKGNFLRKVEYQNGRPVLQ